MPGHQDAAVRTLERVRGAVSVTTTNGRVHGRDLAAPRIAAKASNGAIDLAATTAADVRAETSNGAITVAVPQSHYRVTAKSDNVVVYGDTKADAKSYPLGGALVEARAGNAIVVVKWGGSTYDGLDGKTYKGTKFGYKKTDKAARAMVEYFVGKLS